MKISDSVQNNAAHTKVASTEGTSSAEKNQKAHANRSSTANSATPTVELSEDAQLLRAGVDAVRETDTPASADRAAKLASLKKQIADGSYSVDSGALADRILNDHLNNHFGKNQV